MLFLKIYFLIIINLFNLLILYHFFMIKPINTEHLITD